MSTIAATVVTVVKWTTAKVVELAREWALSSEQGEAHLTMHGEESIGVTNFSHNWGGRSFRVVMGNFLKQPSEAASVTYHDGANGPYHSDGYSLSPLTPEGGVVYESESDTASGADWSRFHCWGPLGAEFLAALYSEWERLRAEKAAIEIAEQKAFGRAAYQRLTKLFPGVAKQVISAIGPGRVDRYIELRQEAEDAIHHASPSCGAATRWRKAMREDHEITTCGKERRVSALKLHFADFLGKTAPESIAGFVPRVARDADLFQSVLDDAVSFACPPRKH